MSLIDLDLHEIDLEQLVVPVSTGTNEETLYLPLNPAQKHGFQNLASHYQETGPNLSSQDIDLLLHAPRTGKTFLLFFLATHAIHNTGRPALYMVDRSKPLDQAQEEFERIFELYMGRKPNIHRHGLQGHINEGEPDIIMATPQFFLFHQRNGEAHHRDFRRHFSFVGIDEFHHWGAPKYRKLLEDIRADRILGSTGTVERMDDTEDSYIILEIVDGRVISEYSTAQGIVDKLLLPPEFHLYAGNINSLLHDILRGRANPKEVNDKYSSAQLDLQYYHFFAPHFEELGRPQTLAFRQNIDSLLEMEELLLAQGIRALPIHSRRRELSEKKLRANLREFMNEPEGAVALSVGMMNESLTFPNLGIVWNMAETGSSSLQAQRHARGTKPIPDGAIDEDYLRRLLDNSGRGKRVRYLDMTFSLHAVAHIRLYQQKILEAMTSRGIPRTRENIEVYGVRVDESVLDFEKDIITSVPTREEFFFALDAHACKLWLQRGAIQRRNPKVALSSPLSIELENGQSIPLLDDEFRNVHRWYQRLTKDENGNVILSTERQALIAKLGINFDEVRTAYQHSRQINKPNPRSPESKAAAYFASDKFWIGLHAYRSLFRTRPNLDIFNIDLHQKEIEVNRHEVAKGFLGNGPKITDEESTEIIKLDIWYAICQEHIEYAPPEVFVGLISEGIAFEDPLVREILARSYLRDLHLLYEGKINTKSFKEKYPKDDAPPSIHFPRGIQLNTPGKEITLEVLPAHIWWRDILRYDATPPSQRYLDFFSLEISTDPNKEKIEAADFAQSQYFALGLAAISTSPVHGLHFFKGNARIPYATQTENLPEANFHVRETAGFYNFDSTGTNFEFDVDQWARDVIAHMPHFDPELQNSIYALFNNRLTTHSVDHEDIVTDGNFFETDFFFAGLHAFKQQRGLRVDTTLGSKEELHGLSDPHRMFNKYIAAARPLYDKKVVRSIGTAEANADFFTYLKAIDIERWAKRVAKEFISAAPEVQLALLLEGFSYDAPLFREIISRSIIEFYEDNKALYNHSLAVFLKNNPTFSLHRSDTLICKPGLPITIEDTTHILEWGIRFSQSWVLTYQATLPSNDYLRFKRTEPFEHSREAQLQQKADLLVNSDYFWIAVEAQRRYCDRATMYSSTGFPVSLPENIEVPRSFTISEQNTIVLTQRIKINLSKFYRDALEVIDYLPNEVRNNLLNILPELDPRNGKPIKPSESKTSRIKDEALKHQQNLHLAYLYYKAWIDSNPNNFRSHIPEGFKKDYKKSTRLEVPHQSTYIAESLLCRFLIDPSSPFYDLEEIRNLRNDLQSSGWSTNNIYGKEMLALDKPLDEIELYYAALLFNSIPKDRLTEFYEEMRTTSMTLGIEGLLPELIHNSDTPVDRMEAQILLYAKAMEKILEQQSLYEAGLSEEKIPSNLVLAAGTIIQLADGTTCALKHNVKFNPGEIENRLQEFRQNFTYNDTSMGNIFSALDTCGYSERSVPEIRFALSLLVLKDFIVRSEGDSLTLSVPTKFIIPKGTRITFPVPGRFPNPPTSRTITLKNDQLYPDALQICRSVLLDFFERHEPDYLDSIFGLPFANVIRFCSRLPISQSEEDSERVANITDLYGRKLLELLPPEKRARFISGIQNEPRITLPLEYDPDSGIKPEPIDYRTLTSFSPLLIPGFSAVPPSFTSDKILFER